MHRRENTAYPHDATGAEHLVQGTLHWSVSWRDAGKPVEEDGTGIAPPPIRRLLLEQHGEWIVRVDHAGAKAEVMRALRSTIGLSLQQATAATRDLPGVVYRGTRGEAMLLAQLLMAGEVTAKIEEASKS